MSEAKTFAMGAGAFAGPLVGIRYVGNLPSKRDTLLNRPRREWRRGEVIDVTEADAKSYLKHPTVWRRADEPWEGGPVPLRLSDEQLGRAVRAWDVDRLSADAEIATRLGPLFEGEVAPESVRAPGTRLDHDDAARLLDFVPGLAAAMVMGPEREVLRQIDSIKPLLLAFPPLLDACIAAEESGLMRKGLGGRLQALRQEIAEANGEVASDHDQQQLFEPERGQ